MRYHNIEKGEPRPPISQEQSLSSGTSLRCEKAPETGMNCRHTLSLYLADANDMEQGRPFPDQNRVICAVPACRSTAHVVRAPPSLQGCRLDL